MKQKPVCVLSGQDGNIYNLLGLAGKALRKDHQYANIERMQNRVFAAASYEEALSIISEYVEVQ